MPVGSLRRIPPVVSPLTLGALTRATIAALRDAPTGHTALADALSARYGARAVALTDGGTSALVLALRLAAGPGGTVAMPAYGCIDLSAAAAQADVRLRLYDLDPATLAPDLDALRAALVRGVDAMVVAPLFGFPADLIAVRALADAHGVALIEDAAQAAGARVGGRLVGSVGDLTVLSFGRGKGMTGGGGGALLAGGTDRFVQSVSAAAAELYGGGGGLVALAKAAAQWALARPALYALPSALPFLRLGEMVYHPAHDPVAMAVGPQALALASLRRADADALERRRQAAMLEQHLRDVPSLEPCTAVPGAEAGYLRFPVRVSDAARVQGAPWGVLRAYPLTVAEHPPAAPLLHGGEEAGPGARALRDRLVTCPVHHLVARSDLTRIAAALRERA